MTLEQELFLSTVSEPLMIEVLPAVRHMVDHDHSETEHFVLALIFALLAEAALIAALVIVGPKTYASIHPGKPPVVHIHAVTLPSPPKPKPQSVPPPPKPALSPKVTPPAPLPLPKPLPKPIPKPLPKPPPRPQPLHKRVTHPVVHRIERPRPISPATVPVRETVPLQPAPSPQEVESALDAYLANLRARVQEHLVIPERIRLLGLSGTTKVAIVLSPNGDLLTVSIVRSSGIGPIDRVAIATVKRTIFPPFSPNMPRHPLTFSLLVRIAR